MLTVLMILAIAAFIATVVSAAGHGPLWVPVILITVFMLLQVLPK